MALLSMFSRKALLQNTTYLIIRSYCSKTVERRPWDYIWKPGPYPKTQEQRIAAAKKYGLHISEYEPMDDLGYGNGDYPALPMIGTALKDPYYPYDYPELKRNFDEPINAEVELLCETRYDYGRQYRIPGYMQWISFIAVLSSLYILFYFGNMAPMFHSVVPKQFPSEGTVHYTFEPKDDVPIEESAEDAVISNEM